MSETIPHSAKKHDLEKNNLVQKAIEAAKKAYAVYSNYFVGAAILTKSGKIYTGSNVENTIYSLTTCAERSAAFKAVTEGEKEWSMIAVVTKNKGFPCGACRQVLYEFNPNLIVIVATLDGEIIHETTVSTLLPFAFSPAHLGR